MARLGRIMIGQIARANRVTQNGHWEKGRLGLPNLQNSHTELQGFVLATPKPFGRAITTAFWDQVFGTAVERKRSRMVTGLPTEDM